MAIPYVPLLKPALGSQIVKGHSLGPAGGLVGLWLMNEGGGSIVQDLSGNGNTGSTNGEVWVPEGLFYDGVNNRTSISDNLLPIGSSPRTIIISCKNADTATFGESFSYGTAVPGQHIGLAHNYASAGSFEIGVNGVTWGMNSNVLGTDRHTIVMVLPAGKNNTADILLYIDGIIQSPTLTSGSHQTINTVLSGSAYIGDHHAAIVSYYGTIYYVYVFSRALSASEIAQLYREPFCMFKDPAEVALLGGYQAAAGGTSRRLINSGLASSTLTGGVLAA